MLLYVTLSFWMAYLILLDIHSRSLYHTLSLQSPPVLVHRLHRRLPVSHQISPIDSLLMVLESEFLRWMYHGNSRSHNNSWIGYCRVSRTMITGYKK